ncbi:T9SS type A sorting domain-containing protein [Halocola ammonii]
MTRLILSFTLVLSLSTFDLFAQGEVESPLTSNPQVIQRHLQEREFEPRQARSGASFQLPFVDDFSRYSLSTNDPDIPETYQRWEDNSAFINNDFPIEPPTVGVATLDGLDSTGYPYDFANEFAYGPADTLTSCPINLEPYAASDSVYLSFFYQPAGLGNAPDPQDSLVLEFLSPDGSGGGSWNPVWSVSGPEDNQSAPFERVFIHINQALNLSDGFQFRFRNYATISGAVDQWHIDYVVVDQGATPGNAELVDVAFVYDEFTLLDGYSAMPWPHFIQNPEAYMANSRQVFMANLENENNNVSYGFRVGYQGSFTDVPNSNVITAFEANSILPVDVEIKEDPYNFVYDDTVNDTCAYFDVEFYLNESNDANRNNDTIRFVQDFTNYYAYDDGTAEGAYGVTSAGGKVAMQFEVQSPDTLLGLFIHFIPFRLDNSDRTFLLRAWGDGGGVPGEELGENFGFNSPQYFNLGHNIFDYFEYDDPIPVDGTIYVGWVQDAAESYNIGNDRNTAQNVERLFYTLGAQGDWQQSTASGTIMLRPVFKSGKSEVWNSVEELSEEQVAVYPNPTTGLLNLALEGDRQVEVSVVDITGKQWIRKTVSSATTQLNLTELPAGMYIVRMVDQDSGKAIFKKIIKQ